MMIEKGAIGVFDSGYGGLTVLAELQKQMSEYDYYYLGDNARAPYGSRSFNLIYKFTKQAVYHLFEQGCPLVVLACNTASAKALRTIQQNDLPRDYPNRRVLGVIRPTVELVDSLSETKHIGVLGTMGTIQSGSYDMEVEKLAPNVTVSSLACPMWAPLVENNELDTPGTEYYVKKYLDMIMEKDEKIDTLILGCTHYPMLLPKIREYLPKHINLISQGSYVASSLIDYMKRHPEIDKHCRKEGKTKYFTTEEADRFSSAASIFLGRGLEAEQIEL